MRRYTKRNKNGEKLNISQKDVEETIDKVRSFAIEFLAFLL